MTQPSSSNAAPPAEKPAPQRALATRIIIGFIALALFCGFIALGVWQVERRAWKLALIDRVTTRVAAPAALAPGRADWAGINAKNDEYRHVTVTGHFLNDQETAVYAATDYGAGFWVMTPLERDDSDTIVMVNRGFVPTDHKDAATRRQGQPDGTVRVTGLLRMDEADGTALRDNVPQDNRWYSRDVKAMAQFHGLEPANVAPYFIDADNSKNPGGLPLGGLTRITFHNSHLIYAITWFALALMVAAGAVFALRSGKRRD
ncbi:SURF1 family protein [Thalassospira mesophila]|uniref:SURF1-like protein n=1 Tax=Thalassospira mesophila TaxID=1293891 RepID=A0A1Y2KW33_9PROT|nr:SURF1 family protein [Thalassospira mesophila]OSQ35762.1 hypothetical protein TMES_20315 [Thalassospira mesophila]